MNRSLVLKLVFCIGIIETLKLNRQRPSTVWGVQKKLFSRKLEKQFFKSIDGTYHFEYDTGNSEHQMFRNEKRLLDGTVVGFFGYIDPEGILRITEYVAGRYGYKQRLILRYPISMNEYFNYCTEIFNFLNMENNIVKQLKPLIEVLTHSGTYTLDESTFKEVKKICKSSEENITLAYSLILAQLKKNNSQIRFLAFQLIKELFKRSSLFRKTLIKDLNIIFQLTTEINSLKMLPPPKSFADSLKSLAVSTLKEWVDKFGEVYKKLKVAYTYFEKCNLVDFTTLEIRNSSEQAVSNEGLRNLELVNREKIKKVFEEFHSNESEIEMTITSLTNCLYLLLPPAENFFISESDTKTTEIIVCSSTSTSEVNKVCCSETRIASEYEENHDIAESQLLSEKNCLREFGIPLDYNLILNINCKDKFKVEKTEENNSVIENAKDCSKLICNKFLPMVKKWIKIYTKCSNRNNAELKKIIDIKEKLENIIKKYNSIVFDDPSKVVFDENSSEDEFEEVKKEGYEESIDFPEDMELNIFKDNFDLKQSLESEFCKTTVKDAEPVASTSKAGTSNESTSKELNRKQKLLSIAPKLPYDIDLYHWEDDKLTTPTILSTKIDVDKFWGCSSSDDIHEIPNPNGIAALRTRVIEFTGTFEPVKWSCRAPLPNGKLCPRKDRFKCPFHGKIVPRDEEGIIQNKKGSKSLNQSKQECASETSYCQDPELLSDIQAATGIDLKIPDKRGKKRKLKDKNLTHKKMKTSSVALKILENKKLPGLVDVVRKQNSAYTRLSKKIFNKSSMRRVSSVLNKIDRFKFRDKYGDQFNYF